MNYFLFGNKRAGEWAGEIWDTESILQSGRYYFEVNDANTHLPKNGDKVIFKEFGSQKLWGQAVIASNLKKDREYDREVVYFELKDIQTWLYELHRNAIQDALSNQNVRLRIVELSKEEYELIIREMNANSPITKEEIDQLKSLWESYKAKNTDDVLNTKQEDLERDLSLWKKYRGKIIDGSFSIDDYANTVENAGGGKKEIGYYLCNFMERTSRDTFAPAKPGNMYRFGVKMNTDNSSYTRRSDKAVIDRNEAEQLFNADIKVLLTDIVNADSIESQMEIAENKDSELIAMQLRRKVVVFENPLELLYIYADPTINELYNKFIGENGAATHNLAKNRAVCKLLKDILVTGETMSEISRLSSFLWRYTHSVGIANENDPNVVLYGPPGTGKTFSVEESLKFICQGEINRYEVVQFHPSFTYEDFIEGIKPKGMDASGNIKFELVNGVFKEFCIRAKNDPDNNYYFVVDEINRANLSAVFGETLSKLERGYRHDPKDGGTDNLIKTQYSTLLSGLIKDDPSQKSKAYYYDEPTKAAYFGVPKNLFFIGMMNDVDKSIDTFDLALRRRFKWERKDCDYGVIDQFTTFKERKGSDNEFMNIGNYIAACENLNNYISKDLSLGKSYEFGHSFFMKMSAIASSRVISENNMKTLFNRYLRPTLKEYMRALYAETELDEKLKIALNKFVEPIK